jgi:uridine kinase
VTFVRRFQRDLREHRKPPFTLLRRGLLLLRDDPQVVRRCVEAGCEPMVPKVARRRIETLLTRSTSV